MRGLMALQPIPRSSVIVAVPDEAVLALSNFPQFELAESVGESLPPQMTDLRERLRVCGVIVGCITWSLW
jgi:hypothetical protein